MDEEKTMCFLTRLRSLLENMLACGYGIKDEGKVNLLIEALEEGTNLTDIQIEKAILNLERAQAIRHESSYRKDVDEDSKKH